MKIQEKTQFFPYATGLVGVKKLTEKCGKIGEGFKKKVVIKRKKL